jgi:hypothetical protein
MNKPSKIFLAGLIVAGIVWTAGTVDSKKLERMEANLQAVCISQTAKGRANLAKQQDRSLVGLSDEALIALANQRGLNPHDLFQQRDAQVDVVPVEDLYLPPELVCDGAELQSAGPAYLASYQSELLAAHEATTSSKPWPNLIALVLLAIGATPWLWYFLLRRIAELRSAISGKPPI